MGCRGELAVKGGNGDTISVPISYQLSPDVGEAVLDNGVVRIEHTDSWAKSRVVEEGPLQAHSDQLIKVHPQSLLQGTPMPMRLKLRVSLARRA